jgi:Mg-chelatase subunit ChlD
MPQAGGGPLGTVAWTASGDGLIAADISDESEFAVFDVDENISLRTRLTTCAFPGSQKPNDILTANGLMTPSPTPSASAEITSTPTTATPSLTSTDVPPAPPTAHVIYFPVLVSEECNPDLEHVDVALVLDASTSMLDPVRADSTKLDLAIDAARQVITLLKDGDQVALVTFNVNATVIQTLTGDFEVAGATLDHVTAAEYTRLDLGVKDGRQELVSTRRNWSNPSVLIILTDGKANPVPVSVAMAEAETAKEAEITLFTIGLGRPEDLDAEALRLMASREEYFYMTPNAEELGDIYESIARVIPCRPERFWGGR